MNWRDATIIQLGEMSLFDIVGWKYMNYGLDDGEVFSDKRILNYLQERINKASGQQHQIRSFTDFQNALMELRERKG